MKGVSPKEPAIVDGRWKPRLCHMESWKANEYLYWTMLTIGLIWILPSPLKPEEKTATPSLSIKLSKFCVSRSNDLFNACSSAVVLFGFLSWSSLETTDDSMDSFIENCVYGT